MVDKGESGSNDKDSVPEMVQVSVVEHRDGDNSACNEENTTDSVSSTDGTDDSDSDPNDKQDQGVEHSEDLLDHALYCASRGGCTTLPEAEGWYEVVRHKLHMAGIKDSSVYCLIQDGQGWTIWTALNGGSYSTVV